MSSENPFAFRPPKPALALRDETRKGLILEAVTVAERNPPKSRTARLHFLKGLLRKAAGELIPAAEKMIGATGPEKKQLVHRQLMDILRSLEQKLGLIPDFLEPAAFGVLELAIDGIIETVFRQLEKRGVVNRPPVS